MLTKDADGNEIEVFTKEEVAQREADALATYQKDHPDQSAALTEATTALDKAKADLTAALASGGDDKDKNFAALRKQVTDATTLAEKIRTDSLLEMEKLRNVPTQEYRGELVDRLAGTDKTLKEKIEIRYKELSGMPETNKTEVRARMDAAYKLAADGNAATILDGGVGRGSFRGDGGMPQSTTQESENSTLMRGALGISDDQAKKFAPKPGQPGYQG